MNLLPETDYRDNFNEVPFDEDMLKPSKIRDAQKAYEYAAREVARGGYRKCFMAVPLLAVMHLQGIGTPKNIPKAVELLRGHDFFEPAKDYFDARERFPQLIAYLYYRGIGVEKNEAKAREILKRHARFHKKAWRNFYCGYIAPKDFEFSVFILENIGEAWAANALADIYSGKYSLADADDKKRDMWRVRAKVLSSKDKTK
ncbi:MAG: hypothetical protein IJI37_05275 [Opitutales bacterium]|nr:hypothetical protein [Opitutales bacterium]